MNINFNNANKKTKEFVLDVINDIGYYQSAWNDTRQTIHLDKQILTNEYLTAIPEYAYYPIDIRKTLESANLLLYNCIFVIGKRQINVHVISPECRTIKQTIVKYIFMWLHVIIKYSPESCSQSLDIYLSLTSNLKTLPNVGGYSINQSHANTAFTFSCKEKNHIHIYRKEEWFKVFIHESFHAFGIDFSETDAGYSDKYAFEIFPVSTDFKLYEAYCETWATIIHILFIYQQNDNLQLNDPRVVFNDINKLLEKEVMFSLFQCCKILVHFKISYDDMCNINTNGHMSKINNFKETTPIISYFFFKTILLFNACKFADWCSLNNMNNMLMFSDDNHEYRKKRDFAGMIKDLYREVNFLRYITYVQTKYNEADVDAFSANTLRMTLLDV